MSDSPDRLANLDEPGLAGSSDPTNGGSSGPPPSPGTGTVVRDDDDDDDDGGIPLLGMGVKIVDRDQDREDDQREIFGHLIPGPSASDDALWLQDALAVVDTAINQLAWMVAYFAPAEYFFARVLIAFAPYIVDAFLDPPNLYQALTRPFSDQVGARTLTDALEDPFRRLRDAWSIQSKEH